MKTITCDRCGKEFDLEKEMEAYFLSVEDSNPVIKSLLKHRDYCSKCFNIIMPKIIDLLNEVVDS